MELLIFAGSCPIALSQSINIFCVLVVLDGNRVFVFTEQPRVKMRGCCGCAAEVQVVVSHIS
jgi:hypothetical protein